METLVATVLIIIVFVMAGMILNTIFSSTVKNNTHAIDTELVELEYLYHNDKLVVPFYKEIDQWHITIDRFNEEDQNKIEFEAINQVTNKTISKTIIDTKN